MTTRRRFRGGRGRHVIVPAAPQCPPHVVDYRFRKAQTLLAQAELRDAGAAYETAVGCLNRGAAQWVITSQVSPAAALFFGSAIEGLERSVKMLNASVTALQPCIDDLTAEYEAPSSQDARVIDLRLKEVEGVKLLMEQLAEQIGRLRDHLLEVGSHKVFAGFCDQASKGRVMISKIRHTQRFWLGLQHRVFKAGVLAASLLNDRMLSPEREDNGDIKAAMAREQEVEAARYSRADGRGQGLLNGSTLRVF